MHNYYTLAISVDYRSVHYMGLVCTKLVYTFGFIPKIATQPYVYASVNPRPNMTSLLGVSHGIQLLCMLYNQLCFMDISKQLAQRVICL